jgi:hypothetical protein
MRMTFDPSTSDRLFFCGWRAGASDISELRSELEQINPKIMLMSARMDGGAVNLGPLLS